jgi:hypothetical protein
MTDTLHTTYLDDILHRRDVSSNTYLISKQIYSEDIPISHQMSRTTSFKFDKITSTEI